MEKIALAWSGGKDSAYALNKLNEDPLYEVTSLLTTVIGDFDDRVGIHGVRETLLNSQATTLRIPLHKVFITKDGSDEESESKMRIALEDLKAKGITKVAFGDIFLEDVRSYREEQLGKLGMTAFFPLWGIDTNELAREFIDTGFKAVVVCVDTKVLDGSFAGRLYNDNFLNSLPDGVDPCGENGEFHSFVFEGSDFGESIGFRWGEVVLRDDRFSYCDIIPDNTPKR